MPASSKDRLDLELLNFNPVARMDLLSVANDHRRCGPLFNVEDDQLTNDLSDVGAALLSFLGRYDAAAGIVTRLASGLIRKLATSVFETSVIANPSLNRLIRRVSAKVPFTQRTEHRHVVADANIVLGPEVNVNDLLSAENLLIIAGHKEPPTSLS